MRYKATCPHCLEGIALHLGMFRCTEMCSHHKMSKDPLLEARWNDSEAVMQSFKVRGVTPPIPFFGRPRRNVLCPVSGVTATDRICPKCGRSLYASFGEKASECLTVVGAKDAGKSTYIGVLFKTLEEKVGGRFGWALRGIDQRTRDDYRKRYSTPLFDQLRLPDSTMRATKSDAIPALVFEITEPRKSSSRGTARYATITAFDPPGEVEERQINLYYRFLYRSEGIVLLIDGDGFKEGRPERSIRDAENWLSLIISQLDAHRPAFLPEARPRLAVAISKGDQLKNDPDLQWVLQQRESTESNWSEREFLKISEAVQDFLRRNGGSNLCNMAENRLGTDHVGYFLVSQIGFDPGKDKTLSKRPEPFRVADPFLWLLSKNGIVPNRSAE